MESRVGAGRLKPDIIRNLKATNSHLRAEKDSAVRELKRLQSSVRATQMNESTAENRVLLEEVDRLRQMNAVLKGQLAAKEEACARQVSSLREELQQLKQERRACVCLASQKETWNREGWGYDEQSTAKQLLNRSRCAYDAVFHALRFCEESSVTNLGPSNTSKHPVDVQIRVLVDFLSEQSCRMQKELVRATGQLVATEAGDSTLKAPVKKTRAQTRPSGPPAGVAARLDVACRAVTASVEGLKTVSQSAFAQDSKMRASARSFGAVVTEFVKLHTQLEPSLFARRPATATHSSQASCNRTSQPSVSGSGQGTASQQRVHTSPAPSISHSQMPVSGFFGAASLQSKGSGISCTEVPSTNGSQIFGGGAESVGPSEAGQPSIAETQNLTTNDQDATQTSKVAEAEHSPAESVVSGEMGACATDVVADAGGEDSPQLPTESEVTHHEPAQAQATSGGAMAHSTRTQTVGDCSSRSATSISSSVFSDGDEADFSEALNSSEFGASHGQPPIPQPTSPPLGVDVAADEGSLDRSQGGSRDVPLEGASTARSTSARDDISYSKVSCSYSEAGDAGDRPHSHPAASISTHGVAGEHGDSRGVSGTDYCDSEVETVL